MRRIEVTPNVTQLTRFRFVNAFLVREDDGFTLVDTALKAAEQILGLGVPLRRIALTHGHGDHVGSLDALKARLGDAVEVLMPHEDARIHAGEREKTAGSWPTLATKPDTLLHAGDRVGSLEVHATPGHTPGHVSFLDTRDRTLIAGDVFTTYGGVQVTDHLHPRFPFAAMATWDRTADRESARALRALEPATLVVGHGPPVGRPLAAIDRAIG